MELKKIQLYITLMLALLPCLNAYSSPVMGKEYIRASVTEARNEIENGCSHLVTLSV